MAARPASSVTSADLLPARLPEVGFCRSWCAGTSMKATVTSARSGVPSVSKSLYSAVALARYAVKNWLLPHVNVSHGGLGAPRLSDDSVGFVHASSWSTSPATPRPLPQEAKSTVILNPRGRVPMNSASGALAAASCGSCFHVAVLLIVYCVGLKAHV